jgi:hypothetical protein
MYAKFWYEHVKEKSHLEDVGVDRIILKWSLKCRNFSGHGTVASSCEDNPEHSGSIKCGRFIG